LLDGFIAVLIGRHGYNDDGQKQLHPSGDKRVKVPDVGEIKDPLIC
jgi:hypothetical protein